MKLRITISVDEHLATKIAELAERSGLSSSAVVNTCLRYALPQLENGAMLNPSPIAQPPGRKPISVLLVEDSDTDADLLIRALRQADYEPSYEMVQTSKEMEKALRLVDGTSFSPIGCCRISAVWKLCRCTSVPAPKFLLSSCPDGSAKKPPWKPCGLGPMITF